MDYGGAVDSSVLDPRIYGAKGLSAPKILGAWPVPNWPSLKPHHKGLYHYLHMSLQYQSLLWDITKVYHLPLLASGAFIVSLLNQGIRKSVNMAPAGDRLGMGTCPAGLNQSGTDDDLPPSYQNSRGMKGSGRITGNGRDTIGAGPYTGVQQPQTDMETQVHHLEQQAYCSVLRAFKAQSDAITWEKESLITELRKELRVSDKEHRDLLNRVNSDDIIRRISHCLQEQKKAAPPGTKVKKTKPGQKIPGGPAVKSMPSSAGPSGWGPVINRNTSAGLPPEGPQLNPLIGRKVMTRWPDDNSFYEAAITDYDAAKMAPEDVRWEGEEPDLNLLSHGAPVHGVKKSTSRGGPMLGAGRETLIKEVERVFNAGNPEPLEMERAKKVLKMFWQEHEQSLIDAIARLAEVSDGEGADDHARSLEYNRGWRNQHGGRYADDMANDGLMSEDADAM
ncbi:protein EMSY-LIKE 3-like isoform X1 [Panicum miliaceum]|uniref:Protein EMSY-LIKE 3-like isoform X1 n=1 Tax=Panicum miliaceum TaxID=4540 RepID=A0A3L6PTE9_PANMI|nr:protein EMSY-LIKE 3-like isoform X1 [Panicum miliaceum]